MKTPFLFFATLLCGIIPSRATQLTLSNDVGGTAQYTTIQAAIQAAQLNDTILVQGSPISYGDFDLNKAVSIIGPGHHPTALGAYSAVFGTCYTYQSSSGARLIGLDLATCRQALQDPTQLLDNFIIRNCRLNTLSFYMLTSNCIVEGNFLGTVEMNSVIGCEMIYRNNVFLNVNQSPYPQISNVNSAVIFDHNNFMSINSGCYPFENVRQATISNNIFQFLNLSTSGAMSNSFYNCNVMNNAAFACNDNLPGANNAGSGNLNGTYPDFVNYPGTPAAFNWSFDLHLQANSPLLGAATDGTQIGIYGGNFIFHASGEPIGMPSMNSLNISNVAVPVNGMLNVNFTAEPAE